ncbi:MAG TPA: hypothetical protein VM778_03040 [Gemmatimonadota bacterium]|nr:hypothetical protein [Gemmatimonadota bacterium]
MVFHGAVVLFVGLLCGFAAVVETIGGDLIQWRAAHNALLLAGILLLATASTFPAPVLPRREGTALVLSLIAMAYAFTTAILIQTATGVRSFGATDSPLLLLAFVANVVAVLGALVSTGLVAIGARAALKGPQQD